MVGLKTNLDDPLDKSTIQMILLEFLVDIGRVILVSDLLILLYI